MVALDFGATAGGSIEKTRPALVVQNDAGNTASPMTIVAAIRHDARKGLPIHAAVPSGVGGLTKDSVVDCGILYTVLQTDLGPKRGALPPGLMAEVDRALRISLGLR